jgi:hypothetical protein
VWVQVAPVLFVFFVDSFLCSSLFKLINSIHSPITRSTIWSGLVGGQGSLPLLFSLCHELVPSVGKKESTMISLPSLLIGCQFSSRCQESFLGCKFCFLNLRCCYQIFWEPPTSSVIRHVYLKHLSVLCVLLLLLSL